MQFLRAMLICYVMLIFLGVFYVLLVREPLLDFVEKHVDLQGKVMLPDRADTFSDRLGLFVYISLFWPGELYYILSVWRKQGKK